MLTGENAFSFHRENFFNKSGYTAVEEPTSRLFMDQGSKEQNMYAGHTTWSVCDYSNESYMMSCTLTWYCSLC